MPEADAGMAEEGVEREAWSVGREEECVEREEETVEVVAEGGETPENAGPTKPIWFRCKVQKGRGKSREHGVWRSANEAKSRERASGLATGWATVGLRR